MQPRIHLFGLAIFAKFFLTLIAKNVILHSTGGEEDRGYDFLFCLKTAISNGVFPPFAPRNGLSYLGDRQRGYSPRILYRSRTLGGNKGIANHHGSACQAFIFHLPPMWSPARKGRAPTVNSCSFVALIALALGSSPPNRIASSLPTLSPARGWREAWPPRMRGPLLFWVERPQNLSYIQIGESSQSSPVARKHEFAFEKKSQADFALRASATACMVSSP